MLPRNSQAHVLKFDSGPIGKCYSTDHDRKLIYFWNISIVYEICSKSIETEVVFTETEMNNKTLNFFKIVFLALNTLIPANFLLVEVPLKFFFWYGMKLSYRISLNILHVLKYYLWNYFLVL